MTGFPRSWLDDFLGGFVEVLNALIFLRSPKWGVSENRGPKYSTLNSRILIIRTPK